MKKVTKDDVQKIVLSGLMLIGLIYCYFTFLIGPLNFQETRNTATIAALDKQLAEAKTKLLRTRNLGQDAKTASETLSLVNDQIPDGSPIAWFPPRIRAFFERHNIKDVVVRIGSTDKPADPMLVAYNNVAWTIDIAQVPYGVLGNALSGLENEEMLLEITHFQLSNLGDNLENQRVSFNATTLLR